MVRIPYWKMGITGDWSKNYRVEDGKWFDTIVTEGRNTQLMQTGAFPRLFNCKSCKERLWKRPKFNVYLVFHCWGFWQLLWWSIYCRAGLSLPLKVIRVMHDSTIFPAHRGTCSLLAITYIPSSCLSRAKAEIHFLLIKVREPSCMQTLPLWSLGNLNSV